jgi:hypothetical protein
MATRTAFALAGLGGSNAHGAGFLAAAQALARDRGERSGLLPGLEMISCTSGANGLPEDGAIDGAYARSVILDELTFAADLWAVRPLNRRWLGPVPTNLLAVLDLQIELWMNTSYREQVRALRVIGRLGEEGRRELREQDRKNRDFHRIDLHEVELQRQRGFWTYFVEDIGVFDEAPDSSYARLAERYPG